MGCILSLASVVLREAFVSQSSRGEFEAVGIMRADW